MQHTNHNTWHLSLHKIFGFENIKYLSNTFAILLQCREILLFIYAGRIAKPVTKLHIGLSKNNGHEKEDQEKDMACYVAARPCKQEYDLRRGGQNFHFSLPLTDISIIRYVAKLHCRSAPFCKQYPGPFLASPIINFCSRLSACCICPPSCAVLHVEASCRKLQPSTAPRREGLICSPVDGSV